MIAISRRGSATHLRRGLATSLLAAAPALASAQGQPDGPRFLNPPTLSAPRGYSHVVEVPAGDRLVYVAGQVALDSAGRLVGAGDFRAQATQVFENLRRALAAAGATFGDVVKLNYYVVDAARVPALREVRDRYINTAAPPASTLVEVRRLFRDDVLLEIEATAVVPRR
jgi:enamine deaminase RidA (YjgF/YER057c/UK114 family)